MPGSTATQYFYFSDSANSEFVAPKMYYRSNFLTDQKVHNCQIFTLKCY